jgi:hypothetical protein
MVKMRRIVNSVIARTSPPRKYARAASSPIGARNCFPMNTSARRDRKRFTRDATRPDFFVILVFPNGNAIFVVSKSKTIQTVLTAKAAIVVILAGVGRANVDATMVEMRKIIRVKIPDGTNEK